MNEKRLREGWGMTVMDMQALRGGSSTPLSDDDDGGSWRQVLIQRT